MWLGVLRCVKWYPVSERGSSPCFTGDPGWWIHFLYEPLNPYLMYLLITNVFCYEIILMGIKGLNPFIDQCHNKKKAKENTGSEVQCKKIKGREREPALWCEPLFGCRHYKSWITSPLEQWRSHIYLHVFSCQKEHPNSTFEVTGNRMIEWN